jgi:glycine/D-amino acid oxidase-like deaminating enzyme
MDGVIWARTAREDQRPATALESDEEADVAIVGGGFLGLSAALEAARRGLSVVVLEAGRVGNGASGRNGGFAVPHFPGAITPDSVMARLGRARGEALCELVAAGPDLVKREIERYQIACDAEQNGWIQPAHSPKALAKVRAVYESWRAFGADVTWLDRDALASATGAGCYLGGWRRTNGMMLNPLALARGLARAAANEGARIREESPVDGVGRDAGRPFVSANGHRVSARHVLIATNGYTDALIGDVDRSVIPVHLFHTVTSPLPAEVRERLMPDRVCFTDIRKSGGFGRYDRESRLISGGAVFALGNRRRAGRSHAQARMRQIFPDLPPVTIETYWEGWCAITPDFLPRVQVLAPGVFSILGFSTRGVALATNAGRTFGTFLAGDRSLDEVPLEVSEGAQVIPRHGVKALAGRLIYPLYKAMDRLGMT